MKSHKHAYLILAHEKPEVFKELIHRLDDSRNDIFIHVDKKSDISEFKVCTVNSKIIFLNNRIDCRWGDFSLVEAELDLIESALCEGQYAYLHLISGVDYPLKTQDYIHDYCLEHNGKEFIGFAKNVTEKELKWRSQHYFIFSDEFRHTAFFKRLLRGLFARLQTVVGYRRYRGEVKKGAQWWSITSDFAEYLLSHKTDIRKYFRNTYCPDELFVQTMCWNSSFRNKIYNIDNEFNGCKRYIPWSNGILSDFSSDDFWEMKRSDKWFGRKFTKEDIDKWLGISRYR